MVAPCFPHWYLERPARHVHIGKFPLGLGLQNGPHEVAKNEGFCTVEYGLGRVQLEALAQPAICQSTSRAQHIHNGTLL